MKFLCVVYGSDAVDVDEAVRLVANTRCARAAAASPSRAAG
jgi:hypothetical protein